MTAKANRFPRGSRRAFATLLFLLAACGPAWGASPVADFLRLPVDAASAGAGGAEVARPAALLSPFANAAAAQTQSTTVSIAHVQWLADQRVDAFSLRVPLGPGRYGLALGGQLVDHGSVPRFDAGGSELAPLRPRDMGLGAALGARFGSLHLGAGARYVQEDLDVRRGNGYAFDAGALLMVGPARLGVAARGIGGRMDYEGDGGYSIPAQLAAGASWRQPGSRVELGAEYGETQGEGTSLRGGIHFDAMPNTLVLRAGYHHTADAGSGFSPLRLGFGLSALGITLDYAFLPHDELGQAHMLGLRWSGR